VNGALAEKDRAPTPPEQLPPMSRGGKYAKFPQIVSDTNISRKARRSENSRFAEALCRAVVSNGHEFLRLKLVGPPLGPAYDEDGATTSPPTGLPNSAMPAAKRKRDHPERVEDKGYHRDSSSSHADSQDEWTGRPKPKPSHQKLRKNSHPIRQRPTTSNAAGNTTRGQTAHNFVDLLLDNDDEGGRDGNSQGHFKMPKSTRSARSCSSDGSDDLIAAHSGSFGPPKKLPHSAGKTPVETSTQNGSYSQTPPTSYDSQQRSTPTVNQRPLIPTPRQTPLAFSAPTESKAARVTPSVPSKVFSPQPRASPFTPSGDKTPRTSDRTWRFYIDDDLWVNNNGERPRFGTYTKESLLAEIADRAGGDASRLNCVRIRRINDPKTRAQAHEVSPADQQLPLRFAEVLAEIGKVDTLAKYFDIRFEPIFNTNDGDSQFFL